MNKPRNCFTLKFLVVVSLATFFSASIRAQEKSLGDDRDHGKSMLKRIKEDLKRDYYDPTFRGMDVDARFKEAAAKIDEARSLGQIMGIIATVLGELNDSHTFFIPPARSLETDYGWTMMTVGERCFVSYVAKGSDAEAKGVKPGDEILEAGGYTLDRSNLWKFQYLYNSLRPQLSIRVVLRSPNGEQRQLELLAKHTERKNKVLTYYEHEALAKKAEREAELRHNLFKSFGDQLVIWKMGEFDFTESEVDEAMEKVRKHKALILDLRGNHGGLVSTETRMVSNFFDRDIKICDTVSRKETKPRIAKSRGKEKVFNGKLVVLVDSRSASASEVFARTIQLEKRGTIIGDQTAGRVMTARRYEDKVPVGLKVAYFGFSVTILDLIMSDGMSLEHRGVTPDEVRLPSPEDLAAGRDVVLSYAASLFGVTLDPVEAANLFRTEPVESKQKTK
ncbi:MAG TPA: S41 family peptidase [Pyrinomonadaceae bacterium]|nr:S41 family peptidase [Pyrinomonadaceae bacterium]